MMQHSPCFCTFIPPHVLDHLSKSADPVHQALGHKGIALTERLRGQRDVLGLMPALAVTPGTLRRTVYTAANNEIIPGTVVRGEGSVPSGDVPVDQAYDGAQVVWQFYKTIFRRDSIDDRGMRLDATAHYGADFDNAFWNGSQMIYGDGDGQIFHNFTAAIDVIGHEMTHGVTQAASGLVYSGESGALNEHLSDVFGVLIKQRQLGLSADAATWLVGEGVLIAPAPLPTGAVARAIRDMRNPGTAYKGLSIGDDPQPSSYENLYTGPFDNGGVHINSGIPSKAFVNYACAVGGNAWGVPGKVWYQAATASGLPATATFSQFRAITIQVANQIASATAPALAKAWDDVGVQ